MIEELKANVVKIDVNAGDTLGLFYDERLTREQIESILNALKQVIPDGVNVRVFDNSVKVAVFKWPTTTQTED